MLFGQRMIVFFFLQNPPRALGGGGLHSLAGRRRRRVGQAGHCDAGLVVVPVALLLLLALLQFGALLGEDAADAQRLATVADQRVLRVIGVNQTTRPVADLRVKNVADLVDGSRVMYDGLDGGGIDETEIIDMIVDQKGVAT